MRTLTANELDRVHGGRDGYWHFTGSNGQGLHADPPNCTASYTTRPVLIYGYKYTATLTYNPCTNTTDASINASNGGPTYTLAGGSDGVTGSFFDSFNGNSVGVVIEFGPGGDFEMLQMQFTHDLNHQPEAIRGGSALAAIQSSVQ